MITLFQWPSHGILPNSGLFCMKLESYLRVMKFEHKVVSTINISKSPKKTMPYAEIDGQLISDSQIIMNLLEKKSGAQALDHHLSPQEKSQSTAYRLLIENHLVPILIHFRWFTDTGWDQFSRQIFAGAPALIRLIFGGRMRKGTIEGLRRNGISRHSQEEILAFAKEDFSALSQLLGTKKYVFGDQISTLDLSLFAIVSNVIYGGVDMPLIALVKDYPNLVEHSRRLLKEIYQRDV